MHFFFRLGLNLIKLRNATLFFSTIFFIILCTVVMYLLEPDNFENLLNTFYYVMTTFSTVGYGDYSPITLAGKMVSVLMYIIGIGLLGVVIGKVLDAFSIFRRNREEGRMDYTNEQHIIIIGWGNKTKSAVKEILKSDDTTEVVILDNLPKSPIDIGLDRVSYIQGDATDEATLQKANISKAKSVIIFSDDKIQEPSLRDAKTLTTAIVVERLAPAVHTTVEVLTEKQTVNFSHVNVDEFILSQETISSLAVRSAMYKGVSKIYSQLLSRQQGEDLFKVPKKEGWITYRDAFTELLDNGATLIADGEQLDINRRLDEKIPGDAVLYIICDEETYGKII
ncbi:potassium channel family protein [Lentibacillus sediminis]|uniref:potassium channel family protein n=1 Tax=Lentibacillus sediminis TaxID=1940529 RepID=UPI000C1BA262|nr:potassium channel family protein [Lentibacillus sediminis]